MYFVNNLTAYAAGTGARHAGPLAALGNNWMWSAFGALGCLWPLLQPKKQWGEALLLILSALTLGVFTYANGRTYPYYALILAAFSGMGWTGVLLLVQGAAKKLPRRAVPVTAALGAVLLLGGSVLTAYRTSGNVYLMAYEKEDMPQYRFAGLIRQRADASLLNLGFLDGGFYLAAGVEPETRFFCTFNLSLREQDEDQRQALRAGTVDFVVVRGKQSPGKNYTPVDTCSFPFEGRNWTYTLYEKKPSA